MPFLSVPEAELFYETQGSGPLLILIAGAGGAGAIFHKTAVPLSTSFTVVTYDRRGHSQSILTGPQDYTQRLDRDADDVAALIKHLSSSQDSPTAYVLGSSSGAIVASTVLRRHPALVAKLICHEPPLCNANADADVRKRESDKTIGVYEMYRAKGVHAALRDFSQINLAREDVGALMEIGNPRVDPYWWGNFLYWFERELPVYPLIEMDWPDWERPEVKEKLVMAASEGGPEYPPARAAAAIAERLHLKSGLVSFPGAHLGYYTQPDAFAARVKECLVV